MVSFMEEGGIVKRALEKGGNTFQNFILTRSSKYKFGTYAARLLARALLCEIDWKCGVYNSEHWIMLKADSRRPESAKRSPVSFLSSSIISFSIFTT